MQKIEREAASGFLRSEDVVSIRRTRSSLQLDLARLTVFFFLAPHNDSCCCKIRSEDVSYLPSASCEGALMMFGALAAFVIVQNREAGAALE